MVQGKSINWAKGGERDRATCHVSGGGGPLLSGSVGHGGAHVTGLICLGLALQIPTPWPVRGARFPVVDPVPYKDVVRSGFVLVRLGVNSIPTMVVMKTSDVNSINPGISVEERGAELGRWEMEACNPFAYQGRLCITFGISFFSII